MKHDAPRHPKMHRFMRLAALSRAEAVGYMELFWLWAGDYALDGRLTAHLEEIPLALEWPADKPAFIRTLVEAGFIDERDGEYVIHDWLDHRPAYLSKREKRRTASAREPRGGRKSDLPNPTTPNPTTPQETPPPPNGDSAAKRGGGGGGSAAPAEQKTEQPQAAGSNATASANGNGHLQLGRTEAGPLARIGSMPTGPKRNGIVHRPGDPVPLQDGTIPPKRDATAKARAETLSALEQAGIVDAAERERLADLDGMTAKRVRDWRALLSADAAPATIVAWLEGQAGKAALADASAAQRIAERRAAQGIAAGVG